MAEKLLKDVVKKCLHLGCAEAEASMQTGCSVRVGIERDFEMVDSINHNHIGTRVLLNGKIGLSSMFLTDVSANTISKLAVYSANANPFRDELSSISPSKSLPQEGEKFKHLHSSYEEIINWVKSEAAKINNVFSCRVLSLIFGYESQVVTLCNSHGASGHYVMTVSYIAGSAQTNIAVQPRPIFFICHGIIPGDDIPTILSNQRFIDRLSCSEATSVEELRGRVKFAPLAATQLVSSLAVCRRTQIMYISIRIYRHCA